ncbi:hypothetical protein JCM10450v2_002977 [Rhodotorula kratochvilovae]
MSGTLTYRETLRLVRDYLEVAFHTLLYIRQVYPAELFHQVKKYNVPVWQSRNPALNEYLGRVLECIAEELDKGAVRRVILVIKEDSAEETPLERFIFEFEWLIAQRDMPKQGEDLTPAVHGVAQGDVEDLFRACLLKLSLSQSHLKRLTTGQSPLQPCWFDARTHARARAAVTFAVVLEMRDDAPPPESKAARDGHVPAEWVPAEQRQAAEDDGEGPGRGRPGGELSTISPLEAVRLGVINMDMRVEETAQKFDEGDLMSSGEVELHPVRDRKGKARAV